MSTAQTPPRHSHTTTSTRADSSRHMYICKYHSWTKKKIISQENRSKIRKSLMTSVRENKSYVIRKTDGYLWFQVQLRGILYICVTFSVFRVLSTIIWLEIVRSKGWWLVAHILWTTERLRYLPTATQWLLAVFWPLVQFASRCIVCLHDEIFL